MDGKIKRRVGIMTLGCKVNQYESTAIAEEFEKHGFTIGKFSEKCGVYIINSCTVTAESDRKTRQAVRKFKKLHPESIVVLTGCMPQAFPEYGEKLGEADIVIGNKSNRFLGKYIEQYINGSGRIFAVDLHKNGDAFAGDTIDSFRERTRANIKVVKNGSKWRIIPDEAFINAVSGGFQKALKENNNN